MEELKEEVKGKKYGYIRVSSTGQNLDRQLLDFADRNIELDEVYQEKKSGKDLDRPQLLALMKKAHYGDTIYVTELSRLARSTKDLCEIAEALTVKGVALVSLKENIDLGTNAGKLMFHLLSAIAEFERDCIRERQREGIQAAKASGKRWGNEKKYGLDVEKQNQIFLNYHLDKINLTEAMEQSGDMTYGSFYYQYNHWAKEGGYNIRDKRKKINKNRYLD